MILAFLVLYNHFLSWLCSIEHQCLINYLLLCSFMFPGGVTSMDDFLEKFFPLVYVKKHRAREDNYCKYDNKYLQLFTSSLYLAAILSSFAASFFCKLWGRKPTIQVASIFFLVGAILNAVAQNLGMLIAGRLCLGAGVGFGNQVYNSKLLDKRLFLLAFFAFCTSSDEKMRINAGSAIVHIRNCACQVQRRP